MRPAVDRFMAKVEQEPNTGCWLWLGARMSKQKNGYGFFWAEPGKNMLAHRYSYELHKGVIPNGLVVMHSCDTPLCVNPDHLSVGTHYDNTQDMISKGRQRKPVGGTRGPKLGPRRPHSGKMSQTACDKGHPMSGDNLRVYQYATRRLRVCVTCARERKRNRARFNLTPRGRAS